MEIAQITGLTLILVMLGLFCLLFIPERWRPIIALGIVIFNSVLTSFPAIETLLESESQGIISLPHNLGYLTIRLDKLSAWFVLIINFTSINGILYGIGYLRSYSNLLVNRQLHWMFYIVFHSSMLWVCLFEQGIAFLVAWEIMSLSSFMLVIFEFANKETLRAGINYMVQMHISVVLLTIGFIWLYLHTGSFDFSALARLQHNTGSIWIFILLLVGFAIKAGFIPFHTWLPQAHPAAPSHVSGVMSGVIVKMGIFGMIKTITYLQFDQLIFGEIILGLSVVTALYGIANAAMKFDIKRMLAFCTIENIGIIGIGLGLGLIGLAKANPLLSVLGFSGALLHTLNHSLFKALLFFGAGSVYQQTHTRNIEHLGGLIKKMPYTASFFLIGAIAIGGLPPFNGFVSEFLIYWGLFQGLNSIQEASQVILIILATAGLVIVGGMSIFTFTKTFGIVFLGNPRKEYKHQPTETSFIMHLPQYLIIGVILLIGLVPVPFCKIAYHIVYATFPLSFPAGFVAPVSVLNSLSRIGLLSFIFLAIIAIILAVRFILMWKKPVKRYETWGCGYTTPIVKAQYTGRSFARPFGSLFSFFIKERKNHKKISKVTLYPEKIHFSTYYFDVIGRYLITPLARRLTFALNYFQFIQNGQIQSYVIYGLFFIILVFLGSILNIIK